MANEAPQNTRTDPTPAQIAARTEADKGPAQRWAEDEAAKRQAEPWLDPNVVVTRGPDGQPLYKRPQDAENSRPADNRNALDPVEMLADTDVPKIKIGDLELDEATVCAAVEAKAAEDSRKLSLPQKPDEYKLELPADFKMPGDMKFVFNEQDPLQKGAIDAARDFAMKKGFSQPEFSDMLAVYAASRANEEIMLSTARKAEVEKLGATGVARVTAVNTFLDAHFQKDVAQAFKSTMVTERHVRGWEVIIQKLSNQGGAITVRPGELGSNNLSI